MFIRRSLVALVVCCVCADRGGYGLGPGGTAGCSRRAGAALGAVAGQPRQAAAEGAVRSDRHVAARRTREHLALRAGDVQADAAGAGALRPGREGAEGRRRVSRRHRAVLAGRAAADHDARVADCHDPAADRHLHGQRIHEQPARHLSRRPPAHRSGPRRPQLQRRVDRTMGGRHAGRRYEVLPRPPPLDGSGRRVGAGQRGPAHRRALPDAARRRTSTSSTR